MKKILLCLLAGITALTANAQSSAGLIAHWNMNGTVNDVSGRGHTGHALNITPDTGSTGLPNTAYYFNGRNSIITAANASDLNLTTFSVCATMKIKAFYHGNCQVNTIMSRGRIHVPGNYSVYFYDNPFDGDNCAATDTTKDVLVASAGTNSAATSSWAYAPTFIPNQWYKTIAMWTGTQWKVYINGVLKNTVTSTSGAIGTSSDSLSIGMNLFEAASGDPYNFNGWLDDLRIYNRALSDSEVVHYGDTCGTISLQPASVYAATGSTKKFFLRSTITPASYQWQLDAGTGFANLTNSGPYSGVTTDTLKVTGITASLFGNHYRCIINNTWGCDDTTNSALLASNVTVANIVKEGNIVVYPNPTHSSFNVELPDNYNNANIQVLNLLGQVIVEKNTPALKTELDLIAAPIGVYIVKVETNGNILYKRIVKN